jgi:hypothetical protein
MATSNRKPGQTALVAVEEEDDERYKDFDAARQAQKPIRFKMRGEMYVLPSELPAEVILADVAAIEREDVSSIVHVIKMILGEQNFKRLIYGDPKKPNKEKVDIKDLYSLTEWVAAKYGLNLPSKGGSDNPPA